MREKYIEESFPRYTVFGGPDKDGWCDVYDGNKDIVTHIQLKEAELMIAERNRIVDALIYAINAHGEDKDYAVYLKVAYGIDEEGT